MLLLVDLVSGSMGFSLREFSRKVLPLKAVAAAAAAAMGPV
jgi:hypothetical protein